MLAEELVAGFLVCCPEGTVYDEAEDRWVTIPGKCQDHVKFSDLDAHLALVHGRMPRDTEAETQHQPEDEFVTIVASDVPDNNETLIPCPFAPQGCNFATRRQDALSDHVQQCSLQGPNELCVVRARLEAQSRRADLWQRCAMRLREKMHTLIESKPAQQLMLSYWSHFGKKRPRTSSPSREPGTAMTTRAYYPGNPAGSDDNENNEDSLDIREQERAHLIELGTATSETVLDENGLGNSNSNNNNMNEEVPVDVSGHQAAPSQQQQQFDASAYSTSYRQPEVLVTEQIVDSFVFL